MLSRNFTPAGFLSRLTAHPQLYRDGKRVLECLQRALRVADACMDAAVSIELFVEILNRYTYHFDQQNEAVRGVFPFLLLPFHSHLPSPPLLSLHPSTLSYSLPSPPNNHHPEENNQVSTFPPPPPKQAKLTSSSFASNQVTTKYLNGLIELIHSNLSTSQDSSSVENPKKHFERTLDYIRSRDYEGVVLHPKT